MKSYRENPDGEANQQLTRENKRAVFTAKMENAMTTQKQPWIPKVGERVKLDLGSIHPFVRTVLTEDRMFVDCQVIQVLPNSQRVGVRWNNDPQEFWFDFSQILKNL